LIKVDQLEKELRLMHKGWRVNLTRGKRGLCISVLSTFYQKF